MNRRGQLSHQQSELVDPVWPLHADISVLVIFFVKVRCKPLFRFLVGPWNKLLIFKKKNWIRSCGQGVNVKKREESIVPAAVDIKLNVFTITAYKVVFFMRQFRFRQSTTNRYKSIRIYLSIGIDNRYHSITTRIFAIDSSSIINNNRLSSIIDSIDWIPRVY